jgi:hypothetical protein
MYRMFEDGYLFDFSRMFLRISVDHNSVISYV